MKEGGAKRSFLISSQMRVQGSMVELSKPFHLLGIKKYLFILIAVAVVCFYVKSNMS